MAIIFTDVETARNTCENLQTLLGVRDWDVVVVLKDELPKGKKAMVEYVVGCKSAVISLLADDRLGKLDHQRSLIHELLHLLLSPLDLLIRKNPLAEIVLEQVVNSLAKTVSALLDTIRQNAIQEAVRQASENRVIIDEPQTGPENVV